MSIHNQPQKKHETYIQARARAATLHAASPVLLMQLWSHSVDAAAAATQERLRKCGGRQGGDKGITISHSPREPIVSSSRRNATTKNPAQSLKCPRGRPSEGGVLSRGRPSPPAMVSRCARVRGGRKMLTSLSPRAKRGFHIAWPAPHRCLNRPHPHLHQ
jgi:hypothetical protein